MFELEENSQRKLSEQQIEHEKELDQQRLEHQEHIQVTHTHTDFSASHVIKIRVEFNGNSQYKSAYDR